MKLTPDERNILSALSRCSFLPGSFEKKLSSQLDVDNASPLQQWNLHRLCIKYRKQIGNDIYLMLSKNFMARNPEPPLSRREAEKIARRARREATVIEMRPPTDPPQQGKLL